MKNKTSENRREFVTEWNAQLEVFAVCRYFTENSRWVPLFVIPKLSCRLCLKA